MSGDRAHFGQIDFDAARGELSAAGRSVKLDRSCVAILSALLREAGRDVHKDTLLEAGWPGRVVHENSLAKAVGRLRQALGEDGEALETVHGYGYRLLANLTPPDPSRLAPAPPRRGRLRWPVLAGAALGSIAAAALGLGVLSGEAPITGTRGLDRGEPVDAIGRVLWVDDHPRNNVREKRFLERRKIAVYQVRTGEEALALLAMYEYRAVISDMNREGRPLAGLELVQEMRRRRDRTPFFLYTIVPSKAQRALVAKAGGQGSTVTSDELYAAVLPLFGAGGAGAR